MSSSMNPVICPHCSAPNEFGGQFCESCGMALPALMPSGPRVVSGSAMASTSAGQKLQVEELRKQAKKAAGALLAVAIIQTLVVGVLLLIANGVGKLDLMMRNPVIIGIGGCAVVFWALYFWARAQPLPAAIVGLVLYATLLAINVIVSTQRLSHGGVGNGGFGGIGIGWLDIVILAVLAKAISAGLQYRKMAQGGM